MPSKDDATRNVALAFRELAKTSVKGDGGMTTLLEGIRNWFRPIDSGEDVTLAPYADHLGSAAPHAFVVDDEDGICQLVTMTLDTMGVEADKFHSAQDAV